MEAFCLDRARPSRRSTEAGFGSIREHVFIVGHRVRMLTRFVGVGSRGACGAAWTVGRARRPGGARAIGRIGGRWLRKRIALNPPPATISVVAYGSSVSEKLFEWRIFPPRRCKRKTRPFPQASESLR